MISQILRFKDSVEAWGVSLPFSVQRHQRFKDVPKGSKGCLKILATLSRDGCRFDTFDPSGMWYYYGNNFFNCLTFKYVHGEQTQAQVSQHLKDHAAFLELLGDHVELAPLVELVSSIQAINHGMFYEELVKFLKAQNYKGDVYISLENDSLENVVQCRGFMLAVNRRLLEIDSAATTSDRLDIYGNPCDGYELPLGDVNGLKLYSRNADTKCYRRYGMSSAEACPIGVTSRTQISKILQAIMSKDNEAGKDKPGLWYNLQIPKDQKRQKVDDFVVFTSIFPSEDVVQIGMGHPVSQAEWEAKVASMISALQDQVALKPDFTGEVFIVQKTKGPTVLRYARTISCEELAQCTTEWQKGLFNSTRLPPKVFPPTLGSILYYMNSSWTSKSDKKGGIVVERHNLPFFNLHDVYEFFLGNSTTIRTFCDRFACYGVPPLMEWDLPSPKEVKKEVSPKKEGDVQKKKKNPPHHREALLLIRNLIIYKRGIVKEDFMNHWPFVLGRLFNLANFMYRKFFEDRGAKVPRMPIGHRYYEMAYSNPARAYAEFGKAFAPCLGHWGSAYPPYSKLTTCLYELVGEKGMSEHPTSQDQILLQMGYSHFEPMASGQNDNNTAEADLSDLGSDLQEE